MHRGLTFVNTSASVNSNTNMRSRMYALKARVSSVAPAYIHFQQMDKLGTIPRLVSWYT